MQDLEPAQLAAASQNTFGLGLLTLEAASHPNANVFLSPLSVYLALAMTETGAAGDTRVAMRKTLAVPRDVSEAAFQDAASALSHTLRSRRDVQLSIANALWSDPSLPLAPAFVQRCRDLFQAEATSLNLAAPNAADIINAWVKSKTHDRIPTIVTPPMVAASKAILTNAVYFQAAWRSRFDKEDTADAPFHLAAGGTKQLPFMHQTGLRNAYIGSDIFEAAELPYARSGLSLYALLPKPGKSPAQILEHLSIDKLTGTRTPAELDLKLPRFTLDYSTSLRDALTKLDMGIAFQFPGADFKPLGSNQFYIGDVVHKTRLEVDEQGTVAAAATAVSMLAGAMMPQRAETRVLVFDRPFAVLIVDNATRAILFAGIIYQP